MKLIFFYGPPASGKLTIGAKLADRTGYKLFHNHVTVPVARTVFPDAHEPQHGEAYATLLKKIRLAVIEAAAQEDIDLIFTLAYSGEVDNAFVGQVMHAVESQDGSVHFVQLDSPDEILMERVSNPSRQQLAKMTDHTHLKQVLATRDMRVSVSYPDVLYIDTATISSDDACDRIVEHFRLATK